MALSKLSFELKIRGTVNVLVCAEYNHSLLTGLKLSRPTEMLRKKT